MKTQRDALIKALEARGFTRTAGVDTRRYVVFDRPVGPEYVGNGKHWYVGKAGALRTGPTIRGSIPVTESMRKNLLIQGGFVR